MQEELKLPGPMQRVSHRQITAELSGINYNIWCWTPPVYDTSEDSYPLLVLLDGEMAMGSAIDILSMQSSIGEAQPVVLAAVSTEPAEMHMVQRTIDYSAEVPTDAMRATPPGAPFSFWSIYETMASQLGVQFEDLFGGTDAFYSFLVKQLLPAVQADFRIDTSEIGIAGHSSGGDFAVDTLLRKDTPFSRFIVSSFGTDVLEQNLAEREARFAQLTAPRKLKVFCGYGGGEQDDPFLTQYIDRGVDLMQRLQAADPDNLEVTIRGFEKELHGSVFFHNLSSGVRELWGTGLGFVDALAAQP